LQLLNSGTERSHCSEETVRSQQNENSLGTLELFSQPESLQEECGRKWENAGGGVWIYPGVPHYSEEGRALSAFI